MNDQPEQTFKLFTDKGELKRKKTGGAKDMSELTRGLFPNSQQNIFGFKNSAPYKHTRHSSLLSEDHENMGNLQRF